MTKNTTEFLIDQKLLEFYCSKFVILKGPDKNGYCTALVYPVYKNLNWG